MNVLLVMTNGVRVIVSLDSKKLKKEFADLLRNGSKEEIIELLKRKAQVKTPVIDINEVPLDSKPIITIVERE